MRTRIQWGAVVGLAKSKGGEGAVQWFFSKFGPGSPASESPQKFIKKEKKIPGLPTLNYGIRILKWGAQRYKGIHFLPRT